MIGGGSGCGDWGGVSTGDGSKMGRHKSYLKYVQNGGGGVKATFGECPKARRFFLMSSLEVRIVFLTSSRVYSLMARVSMTWFAASLYLFWSLVARAWYKDLRMMIKEEDHGL